MFVSSVLRIRSQAPSEFKESSLGPHSDTCKPFDKPVVQATCPTTPSLVHWAKRTGAEIGLVDFTWLPELGLRGIEAKQELEAGTPLVRLPGQRAIQTRSDSALRKCPLPQAFCSPVFWRSVPWWVRLALELLYRRFQADPVWRERYEREMSARGSPSTIRKNRGKSRPGDKASISDTDMIWFQALPQEFNTSLLHWSDEEIEWLQYDFLKNAVSEQRRQWTSLYQRYVNSTNMSSWGKSGMQNALVSSKAFFWALECVRSRSFGGPCEPVSWDARLRLTSFAAAVALSFWNLDLIDAGLAINTFASFVLSQFAFDFLYPRLFREFQGIELRKYVLAPIIDMFNHSSAIRSEVEYQYFYDRFVLRVKNKPFKPGDEVRISYGSVGNDELLLTYGFIEEKNPFDTYTIVDRKNQCVLVLEASGEIRNEELVLKTIGHRQMIREHIELELDSKSTTLAEDEALQPNSEREAIARRLRMDKKRILHNALERLDKGA